MIPTFMPATLSHTVCSRSFFFAEVLLFVYFALTKRLDKQIDKQHARITHSELLERTKASFTRYVITYVLKLGKCYTVHLSIHTYCMV